MTKEYMLYAGCNADGQACLYKMDGSGLAPMCIGDWNEILEYLGAEPGEVLRANLSKFQVADDGPKLPDPSKELLAEVEVLRHLAKAWNAFMELQITSYTALDDATEMRLAIHKAQGIVAVRQARRAHPELWR